MTYFSLQNAKIKAVAASVPDDVEYTTDYNDLFWGRTCQEIYHLYRRSAALHITQIGRYCVRFVLCHC